MAPFDLIAIMGKAGTYAVFFLIGVGFGAALEMSGFGDSRKLAAQFYLREMTVLKVMFTAIITACVLIFFFSSFELLDYSRVFVNPTYLWPGILGGLVMGVGFIIGGFCPGTSVVAASTFKIDGVFFLAGVFFGVGMFGEVVSLFEDFWVSSFMGRFTLFDWLGLDAGVVVLLVVLMALFMFWGAEISEAFFGKKVPGKDLKLIPESRIKIAASIVLVLLSGIMIFKGQPNAQDRWQWVSPQDEKLLDKREVYIHPGELLELMRDPSVYLKILDVRSEKDFNLYHLGNARIFDPSEVNDYRKVGELKDVPENTVTVLMSNDEKAATQVWKLLRGQNVINLYILDGGINRWISTFGIDPQTGMRKDVKEREEDSLAFNFQSAIGSRHCSSNPCILDKASQPVLKYEKKVKLKTKSVVQGGCG